MICAVIHASVSIFSGRPLRGVLVSLAGFSTSAKEHNIQPCFDALRCAKQTVLSLLGDATGGHTLDESDAFRDAQDKLDNVLEESRSNFQALLVAIMLNDNERAWMLTLRLQNFYQVFEGSLWPYICSFYRGMSAFGKKCK